MGGCGSGVGRCRRCGNDVDGAGMTWVGVGVAWADVGGVGMTWVLWGRCCVGCGRLWG